MFKELIKKSVIFLCQEACKAYFDEYEKRYPFRRFEMPYVASPGQLGPPYEPTWFSIGNYEENGNIYCCSDKHQWIGTVENGSDKLYIPSAVTDNTILNN